MGRRIVPMQPSRRRASDVPVRVLMKALRVPASHAAMRDAFDLDRCGLRWDDDPLSVIYAILDTRDGDVYFGHTENAYRRRWSHDVRLRRQTHCNYLLRDACPYGIDGRRWRFLVLEEVPEGLARRLARERWWIEHVPDCINARNDQMTREFRAFMGR
jgi:hypothetical protein